MSLPVRVPARSRDSFVWQPLFRAAALFALLSPVFFLAACSRRPATSQIRAITRDLVASAQNAVGPAAKISVHPEFRRLSDGRSALASEEISIELPNIPDRLKLAQRIAAALDRAAARNHLTRVSVASPSSVIAFDYSLHGRRTHSVRIFFAREPLAGPARLAIIIDDMGEDPSAAAALLKLPFPLTFSILPDEPHSTEIAREVHRRGDQVMLHLPMEFEGHAAKAEPVELRLGMRANEVQQILDGMLARVPYAIGVNNHEGSLATANPELMSELMPVLRRKNLFFIDSRTTAATVAYDAAERAGVRAASRKVFLDDLETRQAILRQLDLAARDAQRDGSAIAIGHPHPATIAALAEGLPRLQSRVRLVFASTLVH